MPFNPTKARDYGTTKELVARIIDECGGVKSAAFLGGRAASQVYAYADPAVDAQMPLDIALRLSVASKSTTPAQHAATISGGVFMPIAPSADPLAELSAKSAEEHGELIAALMRAMGDNHLAPAEARGLLAELDECLSALVAMRAKVAEAAQ